MSVTSWYNRYFLWDCGCYWPRTEYDETGARQHCPEHEPEHFTVETWRPAADEAKAPQPIGDGRRAADQGRVCRACFGKGGGFRPDNSGYEQCETCKGSGRVR